MPELPEVETVVQGLRPAMEGARIARVQLNRPDLRFPLPERFAERLAGQRILSLGRRAKYITLDTENGPALICHLGMSGSFRIESDGDDATPGRFHHPRSRASGHDHVVFHLEDSPAGAARIVFNDPRRFGFMLFADGAAASHPMLAGLGVEPTGNALDGPTLSRLFAGKRAPLKAALLDQGLIAGLGNIYVSEALWQAGLSPKREAGTLAAGRGHAARAGRLADSIRDVIRQAIAAGGSSLRDYVHADGSLGYFQHTFRVYDREGKPCPRPGCGGHVKRIVQSGRSTFFCPACQR
ncbi:MAG: bifunctional DNA-formamidopyrimidine glycosylase/DNA-(apurinic or apyrimidinic site) lyase [Rhizobiaceae bacterium]